jgi:hypothetical protein
VTFVSHYEPEGRAATIVREVLAEVGTGFQPSLTPTVWWRGSVRGVVNYYSVGLGLEAGVIVSGGSGDRTATPYAALLIQLPTLVSASLGH